MALATLSHRRDFLKANATGKRFVTSTFILQCQTRDSTHPAGCGARYGFTVTRKMGGAVERNRIKRRLREAVRKKALILSRDGNDYILISRNRALDCPFEVILNDIEFAFSRIHAMKDGHPQRRPAKKPSAPEPT